MVTLSRDFGTLGSLYKVVKEPTSFGIESFYMLSIRLWYDKKITEPDMIGIKWKFCNKTMSHEFPDE